MISLEDCVGMCGLTPEEVTAIAEHEHIPEIAATTLGRYLLIQEHGLEAIRDMIAHDIRTASHGGDIAHAASLMSALRQLIEAHPQLVPGARLA